MSNIHLRTAAILLSLSLLGGCAAAPASQSPTTAISSSEAAEPVPSPTGTPPPTAEPDDDMLYRISLNRGTLIFDSRGNIVEEKESFSIRTDMLTGEPAYQILERTDVEEQRDENGYPVSHDMVAIYDMEGKLLHDWAEYVYTDVFGDYAVRMDSVAYNNMGWDDPEIDEYMALWNYKTGQEIIKDVARAEILDDHSVLLEGIGGELMGIMETGGAEPVFRPAPEGYIYADEWYGYILAEQETDEQYTGKGRTSTLMDRNYTPVFTGQLLNGGYIGLHGRYLLANVADGSETIVDEKGATIYTSPTPEESIDYFDGEIVILSKVENTGGQRIFSRRMLTVDGTQLADGYDSLRYSDKYDDDKRDPADYFVGVRKDAVDILDRSGRITHTAAIPGIESVRILENGLYNYALHPESRIKNKNGRIADGFEGLLDSELNIVLPADRYTSISQCSGTVSGKYRHFDLYRCMRSASGGVARWDILDPSGKVLIENLTQIGAVGPNRIAVVKGFSVGLMDWQGNWIAKQSIFDKLEDEKGDIWG